MGGPYEVRLASPGDLDAIPIVEVASGELFRTVDLEAVAEAPPTAPEALAAAQQGGRLWVGVTESREVIGFALGCYMDGHHHLQQLSVLPAHGRRGLGRALVKAVCAWAWSEGGRHVTLSTFRDVAWNGPYYERLGFRALAECQLGPDLVATRADEQAQGLDISKRVIMQRDL